MKHTEIHYYRRESDWGEFVCIKWNKYGSGQYALVWNGEMWEYNQGLSNELLIENACGTLPYATPKDRGIFLQLYNRSLSYP